MNLTVVVTLGTKRYIIMACSANHSKGSGSAVGAGLIMGQPGWLQRKINLRPQHRGVHLVTEEILRQVDLLRFMDYSMSQNVCTYEMDIGIRYLTFLFSFLSWLSFLSD